jgi:uncharacterized membrane protein YdbT with pleckstrin-like domain
MDLYDHLRRVPLFARLSAGHLVDLADLFDRHTVEAGRIITRQADLGATFNILDRGEAIVHRVDEHGMQKPVEMLHSGDHYGVTALFMASPRDATVRALTEVTLWSLTRPAFARWLAQNPSARRELLIPEEILNRVRAPRYPWLEAGEYVVYHARRHWIAYARTMALSTLMVLSYLAFLVFLSRYAKEPMQWNVMILPALGVYALAAAWNWVNWRNDYFAVTNRRLSHRERVAFISESRKEARLDRVQNINLTQDFLGSRLDYGTLAVTTAADVGSIVFDHVGHPTRFQERIWREISAAQATQRASQRHLIREELQRHTGLVGAPPVGDPETAPDRELESVLDDVIETAEAPELSHGPFERLLEWLTGHGLLLQTRIVAADSITWRKHWIFLAEAIAFPLAMSTLCGVLMMLGFFGVPATWLQAAPVYPYLMLVLTVVMMGWVWWSYDDWGNDQYIVTNERIIDVEKRPLAFEVNRREASLGMIQNVELVIPNFWASSLDFGRVVVQTAGAGEFTFDDVPNPHAVQNEIFARMQAFHERQREREAARRREELAEWFGVYEELRRGDPPTPGPGPAQGG